MSDAPFSFSTKIDGDIYSLRSNEGETQEQFLGRAKLFRELLPKSPVVEKGIPPEVNSKPQQTANGAEKSIKVVSIMLASGGDHPRWVIKGGNLTKFGVTCWPETLEAAGIAKHLDPLKDNKPNGDWIAYYSERTNDENKIVPDKVTRLVKQ